MASADSSNTGLREPVFLGDYSFNTGKLKQFSWLDYVIFAGILLVSAGIGLYHAIKDRKNKSLDNFLLAGRNMNPFPVALSLLASFMSAITLLGTPAEMYNYSTMYLWIGVGYFFVIAGAAHIYIPIFYNLGVTSAYEYLEKRFSRGVRTAASMTFVLQMTLYMAIVLYAPSLALNAVTGFTLWGSVISVGIVCTLYTAFGGMKAVLWTDSFQVIMMVASLLAILIKGDLVVGGIGQAWDSLERTKRLDFTDFRVDPSVRHSVWALTVGGYFTWVSIFGVNQAQVQRAVTCPTLKKAQYAIWLNFPGLCIILYLCCFIGIYMAAFYENCDPVKPGLVTDTNQIIPMFVMDVLGDIIGLPGLFVAGLFSGALSTISSGLNSISACVLEDIVRTYCSNNLRESRARILSQVFALIFGLICLGLTFVAAQLGSILQAALSLFGMIGGPLLGLFSLGMFFPWANKWGAYAGLFGSLILMFWIGVGASVVKPPNEQALRFTNNCNLSAFSLDALMSMNKTTTTVVDDTVPAYGLYTLSYMWYSLTAVLACIVIGLVVSFITGAVKAKEIDPKLMCPLFDVIFPFSFLPESIRKPLRLGVQYKSQTEKSETLPNGHNMKENEKVQTISNGHSLTDKPQDLDIKIIVTKSSEERLDNIANGKPTGHSDIGHACYTNILATSISSESVQKYDTPF
ncbi:sodium-coupled monocarboxylate transporter 2-like [Biomphalaria glabrata]|uniref:Sodium-coupled monocarboxylate transporter 2-like n=1 Tax=Biomphalaria glabrata TaxID=6526 RepID=A0A9W2ZM26_BIOGL|nr:sodium-coupled monocarboxylate transporter 2-like [Biomphalaria glabrata]XP_055876019.1 sodium-coupled monocarboxylate transporter 2-like [Biomphalaria glabrata]XP_055876020.1 sodium-coupled monocarboxylate transporter 2-like [Biomphalaria glabrata]XP_055876021.1 sodium-coupled monocarboxylate transporter 2-like [Biomphalaria glabrata]XP_055876022.1 sodium-coupled monocarboxylate transporter 2-like [Biomphalaria glabrata]XP_055876023.1 sodium-coupled monocarboxylate transporter 2-like [Biom